MLRCAVRERCSFCDREGSEDVPIAADFEDFMDAFMGGVGFFYSKANDDGAPFEDGDFQVTTRDSCEVAEDVSQWAELDGDAENEILEAIQDTIIDDAWVQENWQWMNPGERMGYTWEGFKKTVMYESRFLFMSHEAEDWFDPQRIPVADFFEKLAVGIQRIPGLVKTMPAGSELYRGRMFQEAEGIADHNANTLGSPPRNLAAANRMSPAGISMFYGGDSVDTVIAEIGAHSSYGHAVTGKFRVVKDLPIVDLSELPKRISPFDVSNREIAYIVEFLQSFQADLAKSITLDGREHIEYVPTQVFTEYLRRAAPFEVRGLSFKSAQIEGVNTVVFCDGSGCVEADSVDTEHATLALVPGSVTAHRVVSRVRD
ncbi:HEPN-associated N-terminal domain-containing protein [Rhodococcus gordoniae]|uniref:HEPN-associated N-terminal domain-containing protein n=1 Tax=Rhodococcus gordoniae TaxID=223392 RepID=UPI002413D8BE|nr:HEPN-associated N-terminal domain-containing protein [Rhodococcus sp. Q1]